jgi:predicted Zn-dependent protease
MTLERLARDWKHNPSAATTIALCEALRHSPDAPLVQEVGEFATTRLSTDVGVLVSVARMYMEAQRLADAQGVLVAAGKAAPRAPDVYRWLGEVLLRRGDAARAEKVLARAVQLGSMDRDTHVWLERARDFRPMQAKAGANAVAVELAQELVEPRDLLDSMSENTTDVVARSTLGAPSPFAQPTAAKAAAPSEPDDTVIEVHTAEVHTADDSDQATVVEDVAVTTGPAVPERVAAPLAPRASGPSRSRVAAAPALANSATPPVPHPRDVLDALELAGMYEPRLGAAAAWAQAPKRPKEKGGLTLVAGMVLFVAAAVGTYFFYRDKRAKEHLEAEAILTSVEAQLAAGSPDSLPDAEKKLARAFQLDSRSPRAALGWARERAVVGLVKGGEDLAFEDAMARAKEVGVPEDKYAFARVASFLFQGDTAGAASVMSRWDGPAGGDAWYQLVAGATLERAGSSRARDRYAAVAKLAPELLVAQVALARATAIEGDEQEAMRLARSLRVKMPERAEPVALVALAWGRDPRREDTPAPPEADEVAKRADQLPQGLRFVPYAIAALRAADKRATEEARGELQKGLAFANEPGVGVWLGSIALILGDESLARRAALSALQRSAAYEPARALAARVALLGGRLDDALKATEELDSTSPDVAVVRAAAAYERVDSDGMLRALEAVPPDVRKQPLLAALDLGPDLLSGKVKLDAGKIAIIANDDAPWSDLLAMDAALDSGDLAAADKIAAGWGIGAESRPLRALRLGRLARYEGRLEAADALSQTALDHGTVTPRVLWERAYTLVARNRAAEAPSLIGRFPLVLGPLATWLSVFATASGGNAEAGKGRTASLDPPPASAALDVRVVAASAFAAMKDKRRGSEYVKEILATGSLNPDLVAAALSLGFRKVDRGRRRPIYE